MVKLIICTSLLLFTISCNEVSPPEPVDLKTESYNRFLKMNYRENIEVDSTRIQPYSENKRYWQYNGEPILLLGGSGEDNLFNHPEIWPFGLESHLDLLVRNGGNYVRNTMSSRDQGNPWPFAKNKSGLYDLNTWEGEYWQRFEHFLEMTYERDIIVQIEIWDRFDYAREPWSRNPFNPNNNVNYSTGESGLPEVIQSHPGQKVNPFFRTPPDFEDNPLLLKYQEALVDKILSISLEYPHILYCVSNETNESPRWSDYWSYFIQKRAMDKGVLVFVTEMWDAWDLSSPEHDATFEKPELYTYVDVSQNNHQAGQTHWDNAQKVRNRRLKDGQRPMNSVKIYGGTGHGGSFEEGTRRFWRNIFGGFASSRFHRANHLFEPDGIGLSPLAQVQIRSMRMLTDSMSVFVGEPANHLLSGREEDEAYAFADIGSEYAVYIPGGGSVTIDLTDIAGKLSVQWLDILNSEWYQEEPIAGGEAMELTAPDSRPWAVLLKSR